MNPESIEREEWYWGFQFNWRKADRKMGKVLNADMVQKGFQYSDGINVDTDRFYPCGSAMWGGLYFADMAHLDRYSPFGTKYVEVTLPMFAKVYVDAESDHYKADCLHIGKLKDLKTYNGEDYDYPKGPTAYKGFLSRLYIWRSFHKAYRNLSILSHKLIAPPKDIWKEENTWHWGFYFNWADTETQLSVLMNNYSSDWTYGFNYQLGMNVYGGDFDPSAEYGGNGLYIMDFGEKDINIGYRIIIPMFAKIYKNMDDGVVSYGATKVYVEEI